MPHHIDTSLTLLFSRRSQYIMREFLKIGLSASTQNYEFTGLHNVGYEAHLLSFVAYQTYTGHQRDEYLRYLVITPGFRS